jgi:hypothetical protein
MNCDDLAAGRSFLNGNQIIVAPRELVDRETNFCTLDCGSPA